MISLTCLFPELKRKGLTFTVCDITCLHPRVLTQTMIFPPNDTERAKILSFYASRQNIVGSVERAIAARFGGTDVSRQILGFPGFMHLNLT